MENLSMQEHDKWLKIAKEDLAVAKLALPNELFSSVAYHCQQSAEKSLKAFLVFKDQEIIKTHDLYKNLEMCLKFDRNFDKLYSQIRYLNPFSTKFRYPTEFDIPEFDEAKLAIKYAKNILNFVLKKINEPETGQLDIFEK
ncbi:MAG: HEPN domain-containing protein [bacterium]